MFITVKEKGEKERKEGKKQIARASTVYTHYRDLGCCNPLSPWMLLINITASYKDLVACADH